MSIFLKTEDAFKKFCKSPENLVTFPDLADAYAFYPEQDTQTHSFQVRFRERKA